MSKIVFSIGVAASAALITSPAFATGIPERIPEPSTLSIIGGIAVALLNIMVLAVLMMNRRD